MNVSLTARTPLQLWRRPRRGRSCAHWAIGATLVAALALALAACGSLEKDATAKMDAEQIYAEAKSEMDVGNWSRARSLLEKIEARFPFTRHAQQAQMEIAYTYYKEGETAEAISAADRFLKLNPNHVNADYVQYLKGLATFDDDLGFLGRAFGQDPSTRDPKAMRDAFDVFKELVSKYPNSRYAADASARMNYLVNALAQSEINIAGFYLRRGAYLAAIARAQIAIRDYQNGSAVRAGLQIMIAAYRALDLPELAADTERVLLLNFPGS
jgi:outer membrane protein assembly factor BamD